jgi:hypothetical protein
MGSSTHQRNLRATVEPIHAMGSSARLGNLPATAEPTHAMGSSAHLGNLTGAMEPMHTTGSVHTKVTCLAQWSQCIQRAQRTRW